MTRVAALTQSELQWFVEQCKPARRRTMRQWAEDEIVIPNGRLKGTRYSTATQPYAGLYLDAVDGGRYRRIFSVGPTQSGKTLTCSIVPLCYHLFEVGETVIFGIPSLDIVEDKWRDDILPVIEATRYREWLPRKGAGSRGGKAGARINFSNGATLRFMTGGSGDAGRAAFTSRVVVITEVDSMDEAGDGSREADKITQLEARTRSDYANRRIYGECTATIPDGRIWREYTGGTESRILQPCPLCGAWVGLTRESIVGWQDAETALEAERLSRWACPECGGAWTDAQWRESAHRSLLVHRGQAVDGGVVVGEHPDTDTLGFRWSAADNLFSSAGLVGREEWECARSDDSENKDRELHQFVWALPYEGETVDMGAVTAEIVKTKTETFHRGIIPDDADVLVVAVDVGRWGLHWGLLCGRPDGKTHIADYGYVDCKTDQLGEERAIIVALSELKDMVSAGWNGRKADCAWVDRNYLPHTVCAFTASTNGLWIGSRGYGVSRVKGGVYHKPAQRTKIVRYIGQGFHVSRDLQYKCKVVDVDADAWKAALHDALALPVGEPKCMTIFHAMSKNDHNTLAKHLTAERRRREFVPGKGFVDLWERIRKNNHYLDVFYNASAAIEYARAMRGALNPSTGDSGGKWFA